jgi:sugar lactone lactonase YvrE
VLLDRTPARALLLDTRTGAFSEYATFANLAPCPPLEARPDCSPTLEDRDPMANYAALGPDGSLYVSDFLQGVVWRVPPGGGAAQGWLSDRRLDGGEFGTTGLALAADGRALLIAQGSSAGLGALNPTTGKIYAVEIRPDGSPGELRQLWESRPADLPDGFAIAGSGRLYVPLAGGANQIAVLAPDGSELERFPSSPGDGENGSPVPFDTPSSARFLGTRLIVANQSFSGNRDHQALLDVEVGEAGLPELIPGLDRDPPLLTRVSLSRKRVRAGRRARTRVRFRLSEPATVSFRIERRTRHGWRDTARSFTRRRGAGRSSARFRTRGLRRGRYRISVRAQDAAHNRSARVNRRFRVLRAVRG